MTSLPSFHLISQEHQTYFLHSFGMSHSSTCPSTSLVFLNLLCWPHFFLLTFKFLYSSELDPRLLSSLVMFSPYLISSRRMGLNATHILMNSKNRVLDLHLQLPTCPFKPVHFPTLPSQSMTQGLTILFPSCFTSSPLADLVNFAFWIYLRSTYIFSPHSSHPNSSHHQFYPKCLVSSKLHWS